MRQTLSTFDSVSTSAHWLSGSLTSREMRRRVWHMAPGLLPLILQAVPHADPVSPTLRWIILGVAAALGLRILWGFRQIQRANEANGLSAVAGYALSVMAMVLLFPQHLELAFALLAILAFGDGSATLFGLLLRGPRLPWNRAKSWSGLLAFITVGTVMSSWIYWGESLNAEAADPPVTFATAVLLVAPAVVVAGLCESVKSRINDNVRVGVIGAVMLMLTHLCRPM